MKIILIVEDSEICAETLEIVLESLPGTQTMVFQNLSDVLAALRCEDNRIAALVTDLHMPGNNIVEAGFDLLRQLRAQSRYATLPVVLISGDSDPQLPQRALEHGANAFFSKPYSPAAVRRKLEQLLC
jgi:CheY-like chemotaxis protein